MRISHWRASQLGRRPAPRIGNSPFGKRKEDDERKLRLSQVLIAEWIIWWCLAQGDADASTFGTPFAICFDTSGRETGNASRLANPGRHFAADSVWEMWLECACRAPLPVGAES